MVMEAGTVSGAEVAAIREFNRYYTARIGMLGEGLLHTPYSLTEARVVFELAQREASEVTELRRILGLDAGYLSRILARFERDGLATRERSPADARRQVVRLTEAGRSVFQLLDTRSAEVIRELVAPATGEERRRLVAAMTAIRTILEPPPRGGGVVLRPPRPGDFGWVVHRHGQLYAEEYGWDETFEALVARIVADFVEHRDPLRESAWIAEVDGRPVGCVFCMRKEDTVAQLRLLLVEPSARGMGVGAGLVEQCLDFARQAGYARIVLWTNDVLTQARRIYERAGFVLEAEEPHRSFGHDLVGQTWAHAL
jgi:DNA-binding MarR family transcriptional regulator/GNAT superfamily N-acetyltransferase